jgi:hypothetical protein
MQRYIPNVNPTIDVCWVFIPIRVTLLYSDVIIKDQIGFKKKPRISFQIVGTVAATMSLMAYASYG